MVTNEDADLGARIRAARASAGMMQQDMAARVGMNPVVYGRIELGYRSVRATELRDIASALGMRTDDLLLSRPLSAQELVSAAMSLKHKRDAIHEDFMRARTAALEALEREGADIPDGLNTM